MHIWEIEFEKFRVIHGSIFESDFDKAIKNPEAQEKKLDQPEK